MKHPDPRNRVKGCDHHPRDRPVTAGDFQTPQDKRFHWVLTSVVAQLNWIYVPGKRDCFGLVETVLFSNLLRVLKKKNTAKQKITPELTNTPQVQFFPSKI